MNLQKEYRNLILPVLRGLPVIALLLVIAFLLARRVINYSQSLYQASASIKLDSRDLGIQNFEIFETGKGSAFSNNFLTEVELFRSAALLRRTFEQLNFEVSYYRLGKVKRTELYHDLPFRIAYEIYDEAVYGKLYYLTYLADGHFGISTEAEAIPTSGIAPGERWEAPEHLWLELALEEEWLAENPHTLNAGDRFAIRFNSVETLVKGISDKNLFIKPLDKEVYVVKAYYQHEIPDKAALFVNALLDAYIAQDRDNRNRKAASTLQFIDDEIGEVKQRLDRAERRLARSRKRNRLVDLRQETDALLRQSNQISEQQLHFDIQEVELKNVYDFLITDQSIAGFSSDFSALDDQVLEGTFRKMKNLELERTDLLTRFSEQSIEVAALDEKLRELKDFTLESVRKKMVNIADKREELYRAVIDLDREFRLLPDKERKLLALERNFQLEEQTYRLLAKKRTELSVAQSSNVIFHKIIDYAEVPNHPIAPNKGLIVGGALMVALLLGLFLSFVWNFLMAKLTFIEEYEEKLTLPLLSTVASIPKKQDQMEEQLLPLYRKLQDLDMLRGGKVIAISSSRKKEGKSTIAAGLAQLLSSYGKRTLLIDLDYVSPPPRYLPEGGQTGFSDLLLQPDGSQAPIHPYVLGTADLLGRGQHRPSAVDLCSPQSAQLLAELRQRYDVLLIDAAPLAKNSFGLSALQYGDVNLLVLRKHRTWLRDMGKMEEYLAAFKIKNVFTVLNGFNTLR